MARRSAILIGVAAVGVMALGLAACGGDDDGGETAAETTTATEAAGSGAAGTTVDISAPANGDLAFDQTGVTVASGLVSVNFDNPASISHDVVIEDKSGAEIAKTDQVSEGQVSTSAPLKSGTYTFYCSVDGHRDAGMEGTLTVE